MRLDHVLVCSGTTIRCFLCAPRRFCGAYFRITLSVSEGTGFRRNRPLADAQGYPPSDATNEYPFAACRYAGPASYRQARFERAFFPLWRFIEKPATGRLAAKMAAPRHSKIWGSSLSR